jgi:hypothetical protein
LFEGGTPVLPVLFDSLSDEEVTATNVEAAAAVFDHRMSWDSMATCKATSA